MAENTSNTTVAPPPPPEETTKEEKVEEESEAKAEEEAKSENIEPPPPPQVAAPPPPSTEEEEDEESGSVSPPPPSEIVLDTGTLIWVKVEGYPWWPAKTVSESLADEEMLTQRVKTDTNLVQFFGDNSIFWVDAGNKEACKVYEEYPTLMDEYDGEYQEDLKKAHTTLKRLLNRKKRKRERDFILEDREREGGSKRRKLDVEGTSINTALPKKKKKRKRKLKKDVKNYDILGEFTDSRLEEIRNELGKSVESDSEEDIIKFLVEIISHRITMNQIICYKLGGVINKLRRHKNEEINELSRRIINSWKDVVKNFVQ